jgi:ABC-2 type transport system permease protein
MEDNAAKPAKAPKELPGVPNRFLSALVSRTNDIVVAALFVAIVVAANMVAIQNYARVDLTQDRMYTLSDVSKRTMGGLEDVLHVRYYISRGVLPPQPEFEHIEQDVSDRLAEYAAFSNGRMRFEVVDPLEGGKEISQELKERLEVEGVVTCSDVVKKADKAYPIEFFSSVKLNYADKTEVINEVRDVSNFEYEMTRAVRRMSVAKLPSAGFYFSKKEAGLSRGGGFSNIAGVLRKDALTMPVDLKRDDPVPADIDVLFVVAPNNVPERHRYEIDQFIMRGGRVVFLLDVFDPSNVREAGMGGPPVYFSVESGLDEMLKSYGVTPIAALVFDLDRCGMGRISRVVQTKFGPVQKMEVGRWPWIIRTNKVNYDKGLSFVNQLDDVAFGFPITLEPSGKLLSDKTKKYTPLIRGSSQSWRIMVNPPVIFADQIMNEAAGNPEKCVKDYNSGGEQYTLAAMVEGDFTSFYADKEVPAPAQADSEKGAQGPGQPPRPVPQTVRQTAKPNRVVVIGDADCLGDGFAHPPNEQFFTNLVEWLASGEDLSKIRAKSGRSRPLNFDARKRGLYQAGMIGLMPAVVILAGIVRTLIRRRE